MAYENIRLRKPNFTVVDGYFYMIDDNVDSLIVKTDDGTQAFSYPLSTVIGNEVTSLEYDGRNFWSLETSATNQVTIRQWYLNNYLCSLRKTIVLYNAGVHHYQSSAFTVEHYHRTFTNGESGGSTIRVINTGMASGNILTLGPNSAGQIEEVTIDSVGTGNVTIVGTISNTYAANDPISFYKNIWLFNNYSGTSLGGALYKIDPYTSSYTTHSGGGDYNEINACTFYDMSYVDAGWGDAICYVKGTMMIFANPNDLSSNYGSMAMDNLNADQINTISIYDVAIYGANVYRLQTQATYYDVTYTFTGSSYNYQLSTLDPFVTSISLRAEPAIIPANGVNVSDITAVVKDQFLKPIVGRTVTFTEDDPVGTMTAGTDDTDGYGVATSGYNAGTAAREVKITATVQQSS
jgi:hypothetical protein